MARKPSDDFAKSSQKETENTLPFKVLKGRIDPTEFIMNGNHNNLRKWAYTNKLIAEMK